MTWLRPHGPSLLDTAGVWPTEWWLVYGDTDRKHWWNRWLKPGFQHVMALRRDGAIWLAFKPHAEFLDVDVIRTDETPWQMYPGKIIQRVVALRRQGAIRSRLFLGPITCVEQVKALLGIRSSIRTPWQLYRHCGRRNERSQGHLGQRSHRRRPQAWSADAQG